MIGKMSVFDPVVPKKKVSLVRNHKNNNSQKHFQTSKNELPYLDMIPLENLKVVGIEQTRHSLIS